MSSFYHAPTSELFFTRIAQTKISNCPNLSAHVKLSSPMVNTQAMLVKQAGNTQMQVSMPVAGQPPRTQTVAGTLPATAVSRVLPGRQGVVSVPRAPAMSVGRTLPGRRPMSVALLCRS